MQGARDDAALFEKGKKHWESTAAKAVVLVFAGGAQERKR